MHSYFHRVMFAVQQEHRLLLLLRDTGCIIYLFVYLFIYLFIHFHILFIKYTARHAFISQKF